MQFSFTEEQEMIREAARRFLAEHSTGEAVRAAMESDTGFNAETWRLVCEELGWPAVTIPEAQGGLGLGPVELTALLELAGEHLLCAPFFGSSCLGTYALLVGGNDAQRDRWLPEIAAGATTVAFAVAESGGTWDGASVQLEARRSGEGYVLNGSKRYVIDGVAADLLVVVAREVDALRLFIVPVAELRGFERKALPTLDQTRRQAEYTFIDCVVPASALALSGDAASRALDNIIHLAAIGLAAEQVGVAQRALDMTVAYTKERKQFGRAVGSFQAVKHRCADMMLQVETARSAAYYAACVAQQWLRQECDDAQLALAASLAKSYCSEAGFFCAANAIQMFGGVGFTWEYDVHLYFKRARNAEALFGDPATHREKIAAALLEPGVATVA